MPNMFPAILLAGFVLASLAVSSFAATFQDINILVVTDAHSWIAKHVHDDHSPALDADYGSIASAVLRMKDAAAAEGKDVFFFNNGDHVEGSGLSDASMYTVGIHGYDLFPLIGLMPFDALNIGNHDLYENATIENMKRPGGFIDSWHGRYLTSNVLNATTMQHVGGRYTILTGSNSGVSMLVFGFLYHQLDACQAVTVEAPSVTVTQPWFLEALRQGVASGVKIIVVLAHMDLVDANVNIILAAIRNFANDLPELATIPVQFLTGHSHYRGWQQLDNYSNTFEAGHYLDTLGWISFDLPRPGSMPHFHYEYVDANMDALYNLTGTNNTSFNTDLGLSISASIETTVARLGLRKVLGCPSQRYSYFSALGAPDSLYDLYMNEVIPHAVLDVPTGTNNVPYYLTSTGSLRYDIYPGQFYYDDVFAVAPFTNLFRYVASLTGMQVVAILAKLNGSGSPERGGAESKLPDYIGGPREVNLTSTYDLFFNDYDEPYVVSAIAAVKGTATGNVSVVQWRDDMTKGDFVDTTICWSKRIGEIFPCHAEEDTTMLGRLGQRVQLHTSVADSALVLV